MKLAIIGAGIVGQATGKYFLELWHEVIFCDSNPQILEKIRGAGQQATANIAEAVEKSDACFVCVPTPNTQDGEQDASFILAVSQEIGKALKNKNEYYLVVVKSTVLPGTTRNIALPELGKHSGKKAGIDFGLCMNPEFLTFIQSSWTSEKEMDRKPETENRIVIGQYDEKSGDVLEKIYEKHAAPKIRTTLEEAEFAKYSSNFLLPAKISAFNDLFLVAEAMRQQGISIDTEKIAEIIKLDPRLGKYGTVHGKAYGGPCFEKDPTAFLSFAKKLGITPATLKGVVDTNSEMEKKYGVRK